MAAAPFPAPIRSYDVHVYFFQTDDAQVRLAKEVQSSIREAFPQLEVRKFWAQPIGPHPIGNFEVNLRSPDEFLLLVPWLQLHRRGMPVLVHPNTGNPIKDHIERGMWIGDRVPLNISRLSDEQTGYGYFGAEEP